MNSPPPKEDPKRGIRENNCFQWLVTIYIYIYRERERDSMYIYIYIYLFIYLVLFIYVTGHLERPNGGPWSDPQYAQPTKRISQESGFRGAWLEQVPEVLRQTPYSEGNASKWMLTRVSFQHFNLEQRAWTLELWTFTKDRFRSRQARDFGIRDKPWIIKV